MDQARVCSCLDLKSGYHQIEIDPVDRPKNAFVCHAGLFEFNVMPFGLSSAPSVFQELMNKVLGTSLNKHATAYLDDIILYSESFDKHLEQLNDIFDKLQKAGFKLKMSKCNFLIKEVHYLGHIFLEKGIAPDTEKIRAIKELKPPKSVREVRSVVEMTS